MLKILHMSYFCASVYLQKHKNWTKKIYMQTLYADCIKFSYKLHI